MSSRFEALGSPAGDKGSVSRSRPLAGVRVPGLVPVYPEIRAPERAPGHPGAPPAIPTTLPWLRRQWQRARKAAASGAMGTVATMGTHRPALTKVQELLDGKRRWREARVALDLLRHRLLQQPPEQPHPRRAVHRPAETLRRPQGPVQPSSGDSARSPSAHPGLRLGLGAAGAAAAAAKAAALAPRPPPAARGFPRPRPRGGAGCRTYAAP